MRGSKRGVGYAASDLVTTLACQQQSEYVMRCILSLDYVQVVSEANTTDARCAGEASVYEMKRDGLESSKWILRDVEL